MTKLGMQEAKKPYYRDMTVANIRYPEGANFVEVVFLESARFFLLPKESGAYEVMLGKLEHALSNATPVRIGIDSIESNVIREIV